MYVIKQVMNNFTDSMPKVTDLWDAYISFDNWLTPLKQ